jgi:hypothetical protein
VPYVSDSMVEYCIKGYMNRFKTCTSLIPSSNQFILTMKLLSFLPLLAVATALPAASDVAPRASISKVDGLKFNIDGVTKCKS